ncbi:MAG TPA: zinc-ribbon domain-containing protein [Terriglobales bacterium]|nr:zinc-ribbon domain-containing protein [Terriglobales bacterium]
MFCTSCGAQVTPGQTFCPQCGKPQAMVAAPVSGGRNLAWHLNLLSIFWFVVAALWAIGAAVLLAIGAGAGFAIRSSMERGPEAFVGSFFFYCLGGIVGLIAAVNFLTAWGLHKVRPWGRTLAIVMGIICLLNAPFGTALGIYTLIVLAPAEAGREFERMSLQAQAAMA